MYFRGWILWSPRFLLSHFWLIGKYIFEVFACFCALTFEHPRPNNRHTQDNICEVGGRTWPSCASRKHVVSVTHVGNRGGWLWRCRGTRSGSRCGDWGSGRDTPGISRGEEWGVGRGVWVWWECFWEDFNRCRSVIQRYGRSKYGRVNPDNMGNWNGGRRGRGGKEELFFINVIWTCLWQLSAPQQGQQAHLPHLDPSQISKWRIFWCHKPSLEGVNCRVWWFYI